MRVWYCVTNNEYGNCAGPKSHPECGFRRVVADTALVIEELDRGEWIDRLARALLATNSGPSHNSLEDLSPAAQNVTRRRAVAILDRLQL